MVTLSQPQRVAAGACLLGAVAVICLLSYGAKINAPSTAGDAAQVAPVDQTTAPELDAVSDMVADNIEESVPESSQSGPTFDLVRVDETGSAVIAGKAEPLSDVAIIVSGDQIETVKADNTGAFVALLQLPAAEAALSVGLKQLRDGAVVAVSLQTVLVVSPVPLPDTALVSAPTIVLADQSGAEVLQGGARNAVDAAVSTPLSLDTISYDNSGAVVLSGQGTGAQFVRIYVDNEPIETELVPNDGNWRVVLPDVDQGIYTLRVDEIDDLGKVHARVESPFQRVAPQDIGSDGTTTSETGRVVVQPGLTLWALAENKYGDGRQYVQIFHANRDTIRDADLIYPGQIFKIPD